MKKFFWVVMAVLSITMAPVTYGTTTVTAELPNIIALVNKEPITLNEFRARKHLIMVLNNMSDISKEKDKELDQIVIKNLIDERLLHQSSKNKISEEELQESIETIEQRNKMEKGQLIQFLKSKAVDLNSFKSQIIAEIIKYNLLSGFSKSVTISPKEMNTVILATNSRDAEISAQIFTSKNKENKTLQKMYNLQKRLKGCEVIKPALYADFAILETVVNQKLSGLDPTMQTIVRDLNTHEKSSVFETTDGFKIVLMCDKKVINISSDENDYVLNFLTHKKTSQKTQKFLDDLHKKAYIKVMLPM